MFEWQNEKKMIAVNPCLHFSFFFWVEPFLVLSLRSQQAIKWCKKCKNSNRKVVADVKGERVEVQYLDWKAKKLEWKHFRQGKAAFIYVRRFIHKALHIINNTTFESIYKRKIYRHWKDK